MQRASTIRGSDATPFQDAGAVQRRTRARRIVADVFRTLDAFACFWSICPMEKSNFQASSAQEGAHSIQDRLPLPPALLRSPAPRPAAIWWSDNRCVERLAAHYDRMILCLYLYGCGYSMRNPGAPWGTLASGIAQSAMFFCRRHCCQNSSMRSRVSTPTIDRE